MKLLGPTGASIREALSRMTPVARPLDFTRRSDLPLGALTAADTFASARPQPVALSSIASGVADLAALADPARAYAFPQAFLGQYEQLLTKAGLTANRETANGLLNTLLIREDKPHTAAFVRTVMENSGALDQVLSNMARYVSNPTNAILTEAISDVAGAFDRVAFLPFLGSETLANGLSAAMKRDLDRGAQQLRVAAELGVATDVTVVGQGPSGATLARGLSNNLSSDLTAAVIGGETTFSAGEQWRLNSPTRAVRGEQQGPGGPLNPIDDRVADGDYVGDYYGRANVIDHMTKVSLHSSGLPVLTDTVRSLAKNPEAGGYTLTTASGVAHRTDLVVLASGLGDGPKPLDTPNGTSFVGQQYTLAKAAIERAQADGDLSGLTPFPRWVSTLDFFRARNEFNDPLAMFATAANAGTLKQLTGFEGRVINVAAFQYQVLGGNRVLRLADNGVYDISQFGGEVSRGLNEFFQAQRSESGVGGEYAARALYRTRQPLAQVADTTVAQKVVGVVGFGDSARTALEAVTGFGPDSRSPRQLGIAPKLVWFVGERGPRDCAEFYTGDLVRGFDGFNQALTAKGGPDLASLLRARLNAVSNGTDREVIGAYLNEFQRLLTTQKPKEYFDELLRDSGLTEQDRREAFGVFLQEREAVRPRYNQLVIPIEKGQIELVRERVTDAAPSTAAGVERVLLTLGSGKQTLVDHVLDARGNVNDIPQVLGELARGDRDPFSNPELHEEIEVVDPAGNRLVIGKRLRGEDIFVFGPASNVVKNNTTNVGANKVSIFLNRPLSELGAEALAQEAVLRLRTGQLGTAEARAAAATQLEARLDALRANEQIVVDPATRVEAPPLALRALSPLARSPLERDPLAHQTSLNELLGRVRAAPETAAGQRLTVTIAPLGPDSVGIRGPQGLVEALQGWASSRPAAAFLRSALAGGRPVTIERSFDAQGRLVPVETWI